MDSLRIRSRNLDSIPRPLRDSLPKDADFLPFLPSLRLPLLSRLDIGMEIGANNFNGDLAYHVGLFRSPLHIPFAVNIEGTYSKPEIKFGGKRWKDKRAAEVVSMMQADDRVNLLVEASHYMKSLVHVAATYYQGKYGNLPLKKN